MHRDLKLANILIHFPNLTKEMFLAEDFDLKTYISQVNIVDGSTELVIKIADLGFARKLKEGDLAKTRLGTPLIMAPEVLDGQKYD